MKPVFDEDHALEDVCHHLLPEDVELFRVVLGGIGLRLLEVKVHNDEAED